MPHTAVCVKVFNKYIQDDEKQNQKTGLNCIISLMKTIICIHLLLMKFNCLHGPQGSTISGLYLPRGLHLVILFQPPLPSCLHKHTEFHLLGHLHMQFPGILLPNIFTSMDLLHYLIIFFNITVTRGFVRSAFANIPHPIFLSLCFFILLSFSHNTWQCLKCTYLSLSIYWLSSPLECNPFRW